MTYLRVKWIHNESDAPVLIFSELSDDRWELRKVEVFRDGRIGFADAMTETDQTGLGEAPTPELAEIDADPEFEPMEIAREEFEVVWAKRTQKDRGYWRSLVQTYE